MNICINWAIVLLNGLMCESVTQNAERFLRAKKIKTERVEMKDVFPKKIQQIRNNRHHLNPQL